MTYRVRMGNNARRKQAIIPFSPDSLFTTEVGDFWDLTDKSTLFKNSAGDDPVTTAGDLVRYASGQRTSGANLNLTDSTGFGEYNDGYVSGSGSVGTEHLERINTGGSVTSAGFTLMVSRVAGSGTGGTGTNGIILSAGNTFANSYKYFSITKGSGNVVLGYHAFSSAYNIHTAVQGARDTYIIRSKTGDEFTGEIYKNGAYVGDTSTGFGTNWGRIYLGVQDETVSPNVKRGLMIGRRIDDEEMLNLYNWGAQIEV